MKFDFHNLPFLAGGFDIGIGRTGEKLVEGFCPGLYFIKKPIKWTNDIPTDHEQKTLWRDAKGQGLVEWIIKQRDPEEYVTPYCLPKYEPTFQNIISSGQEDRYPYKDCCDGTEIVASGTGEVYLQDFLNYTKRCINFCDNCNYIPDRWDENQFLSFCETSPNGFTKSFLATKFEQSCDTSQYIVENWDSDSAKRGSSRTQKSPDHWTYICQNPKDECLPFRVWDASKLEKESSLRKSKNWRPPCRRCAQPVGIDVDECEWCLEYYNTNWQGRNLNNYTNLAGGARSLGGPKFWENPKLLGYGDAFGGGAGRGNFGCRYPEQTRHVMYDEFPEAMRCYVDSVNSSRMEKFGMDSSWSIFEINEHLWNSFWSSIILQNRYGQVQNTPWTYSEKCHNWGFFGLQHLFPIGICGGGPVYWDVLATYNFTYGTPYPQAPDDPIPHEKYTCRYHPSWVNADAYPKELVGTASPPPSDAYGLNIRFCSLGPDFAVGTDGSWIFGNWQYKCTTQWEDAAIYKEIEGCEDDLGAQRKLGYFFKNDECTFDIQAPYPKFNAAPNAPRVLTSIDVCAPCEGWTEVTTTFKRNKGLFFVPAPPTGIGYANGCAYTIEEADNYRLRYETKVWEVAPMPNYPASIESVDCDDPSISTKLLDVFDVKDWILKERESKTNSEMIYSGNLSDMITDHGTGVFLTGIAITDQTNTNSRVGISWTIDAPDWYEIQDNCNILDNLPLGANFYQYTNNPNIPETDDGRTYVLREGKTKLGPFLTNTKVVVDYYKQDKYVAQSNWMCLEDWFMITAIPPVKKTFSPHRLQSFHGMGHVVTHVAARERGYNKNYKQPYWFMKYMQDYHCIYDEQYNGARIADLYFQFNEIQYEFNYGMCNILTGVST